MHKPYRPELASDVKVVTSGEGRRRVIAVGLPGADPLELIGPLEILHTTNAVLRESGNRRIGYDIKVVSPTPGKLFGWTGLQLAADAACGDVRGNIDTVLIQAMDWDEASLHDQKFIRWIGRTAPKARRFAAICTASYLLAEAGVLDGRRATTHWAWCDDFASRYPRVHVERDPIYIKDGNIYTSAGATSGLDLTLALVEEDFGRDVALKVAQFLVLFLRRPGNQAQFSVQMKAQLAERDTIRELQTWIQDNLEKDLSVEILAARVAMSPRNFARVFAREVGVSPGKYVERLRLERARQRLEASRLPVTRIASTCGYGTAEAMRIAFVRNLGVSPREYRNRFASAR